VYTGLLLHMGSTTTDVGVTVVCEQLQLRGSSWGVERPPTIQGSEPEEID